MFTVEQINSTHLKGAAPRPPILPFTRRKCRVCRAVACADRGLVKIRNFQNSNNKSAYRYLLTPKGIRAKMALTGAFLRRRLAEYKALWAEIQALGRALPDPHSGRQGK